MPNKKPDQSGRFAYEGLDRVLHEKARLGIMTSLVTRPEGLLFSELKHLCALTDGNLSRHLDVLREAGLVEVWKGFENRRPQTLCRLSADGRARFLAYLEQLEQVIRDAMPKAAKRAARVPDLPKGWQPAYKREKAKGKREKQEAKGQLRQPPAVIRDECAPFVVQLHEVREHGVGGGGGQHRWQFPIHARGNLFGCHQPRTQGPDHLGFPLGAMRHVFIDQPAGVVDDGAMARQQAPGQQVPYPCERVQVVAQVAALACGDDNRSAGPNEISAIQVPRALVEKTQMVRRMTWRMDDTQVGIAGLDHAVRQFRVPDHTRRGPPFRNRRQSANVIRMAVRNEDAIEGPAAKRGSNRIQMRRVAHACVDERRNASL